MKERSIFTKQDRSAKVVYLAESNCNITFRKIRSLRYSKNDRLLYKFHKQNITFKFLATFLKIVIVKMSTSFLVIHSNQP